MTLKEVSINSYESEEEQREKREFEIYWNGTLKAKYKDSTTEVKMEGFHRKLVESHEDILIFDERPNILKHEIKHTEWARDKKGHVEWKVSKPTEEDLKWRRATTETGQASVAWNAWQARARLGIQMDTILSAPLMEKESKQIPNSR